MGSFVPIGKKGGCGYDPACTRGHQVTGTLSTWMRVLIPVPGRGGTQPALLQSNFANHILWVKSGLVPPFPFWGQNSLVCGGVFAEVGQQNNDPLSSNWNDSVFSHRLILNYPRFSALIKMIKTAHIIFCAILLIFFRLIAANWLLTFITMHGTFIPSVLAWTVDHFILCYFFKLNFVSK